MRSHNPENVLTHVSAAEIEEKATKASTELLQAQADKESSDFTLRTLTKRASLYQGMAEAVGPEEMQDPRKVVIDRVAQAIADLNASLGDSEEEEVPMNSDEYGLVLFIDEWVSP